MSEPLIWTSKGNIPMAGLVHQVAWDVTPEQIVFVERYLLGDEVVKQSSHVHIISGAGSVGVAANLTEN